MLPEGDLIDSPIRNHKLHKELHKGKPSGLFNLDHPVTLNAPALLLVEPKETSFNPYFDI